MDTTRKTAIAIYNLVKYINPYEVCDIDKEEIVDSIMSLDLEENISQLQDYISDTYSDVRSLVEDDKAMRQYLSIYNKLKR